MSWLKKLKSGLSKSSGKITEGITGIFTKRQLDGAMLDELEELLITADMGAATAAKIVDRFGKGRFNKEIGEDEVKEALAKEIAAVLEPVAKQLDIPKGKGTQVVLMVGVNGNGKTTTLGKLALQYKEQGYKVMLAACDTFRAAAVQQLQVWADRAGCPCFTGAENADPASVAFAALEEARAKKVDVLFIDTAGRLQNKSGLMEELAKIIRVMKKLDDNAPHHTLLVLDATTGQNAHSQAQTFKEMAQISGLIVTKLDGTAKGGVVVALADTIGLPLYAVGVGEAIEDLKDFSATDFARGLMGL